MTHPAPDPSPLSDSAKSEMLQLVSAEFDGELSAADRDALQRLEQMYPAAVRGARDDFSQLRVLLKSLPVIPVGRELTIFAELPKRYATKSRFRWVAVAASTCLALGVMFAISRIRSASTDVDAQPIVAANSTMEATAASKAMAPRSSSSDESDLTDRTDRSGAGAIEASASAQPILSTEDWDVVVLTVPTDDRAMAMAQIAEFVDQHGLEMPSIEEQEPSADWFGVVLTSAELDRKAFLDDAVSEGVAESAQWDPLSIAETSREDLLAAVQRSLQSPTKSELFHGQVYVAVPREKPADAALVAKVGAVPKTTNPVARTGSESASAAAGDARIKVEPTTSGERPLLVVFHFAERITSGATSDGRI